MPTIRRMNATLGSVMTARNREIHPGSMASTMASFVARRCVSPPATSTTRPSTCLSNSAGSRAMRSMTFACNAALAERLAASRTAFSAQSALRPRSSARLRMKATASFVTFAVMASFGSGWRSLSFLSLPSLSGVPLGRPGIGPPICTGVAAPMIGARRHRRDMRRIENIGAGARRMGSGGSDVTDDGNGRGEHIRDDLAHAGVETARCIQTQNDDLGASFACLGQSVLHVTGRSPVRSLRRSK